MHAHDFISALSLLAVLVTTDGATDERTVDSMFPRLTQIYSGRRTNPGQHRGIPPRTGYRWRYSRYMKAARPPADGSPVLRFRPDPRRLNALPVPVRTSDTSTTSTTDRYSATSLSSTESVMAGDTAVLHCSFALTAGHHHRNGHIAWYRRPFRGRDQLIAKGNRVHTKDHRVRVLAVPDSAVSVLLIKRVHHGDRGRYRCSTRLARVSNQFVLLNVTKPALHLKKLESVNNNQIIRLVDTQALDAGDEQADTKTDTAKSNNLKERSRTPSHRVKSDRKQLKGDSSHSAQTVRRQETTMAGARIVLRCMGENDFRYRVSWTGKREDGSRIQFDDGSDTFRGNELVIASVNAEKHGGVYSCVSREPSGAVKSMRDFKVNIEDRPWPISLFVQGFNTDMMLDKLSRKPRFGRSVSLRCESGGRPLPRVTWYKNGVLLHRNKELRIRTRTPSYRQNTVISRLVLRNFLPADQGRYSCRAESTKGFRERSVDLEGSSTPRHQQRPG